MRAEDCGIKASCHAYIKSQAPLAQQAGRGSGIQKRIKEEETFVVALMPPSPPQHLSVMSQTCKVNARSSVFAATLQ